MNSAFAESSIGDSGFHSGGYAFAYKRDRHDGSSASGYDMRRRHECAAKAELGRRRTKLRIYGDHSRPPSADGNAAIARRSNAMARAPRGNRTARGIIAIELGGVEDSVIRAVGNAE